MKTEDGSPHLEIDRFHLAVRLDSLFFPLGADDVSPVLSEMGYTMNREIQRRRLPAIEGARIEIVGNIASKDEGGMSVRIDADRAILAVQGFGVEPVTKDFSELQRWILEHLSVDLNGESRFYEYLLNGEMKAGADRNPIDTFARIGPDSKEIYSRFSRRLGSPVTNFGIRLVRSGELPGRNDWREIRIEPSVQRPSTTYFVNVIYRSSDERAVMEDARAISDLVPGLIKDIEEAN